MSAELDALLEATRRNPDDDLPRLERLQRLDLCGNRFSPAMAEVGVPASAGLPPKTG